MCSSAGRLVSAAMVAAKTWSPAAVRGSRVIGCSVVRSTSAASSESLGGRSVRPSRARLWRLEVWVSMRPSTTSRSPASRLTAVEPTAVSPSSAERVAEHAGGLSDGEAGDGRVEVGLGEVDEPGDPGERDALPVDAQLLHERRGPGAGTPVDHRELDVGLVRVDEVLVGVGGDPMHDDEVGPVVRGDRPEDVVPSQHRGWRSGGHVDEVPCLERFGGDQAGDLELAEQVLAARR